jgi:hypothetical protein
MAVLDVGTCRALQCLHDHSEVRAIAVMETSIWIQKRVKGTSKCILPVSINIYGMHGEVNEVGDKLSKMDVFLQHPLFLEPGYDYFNPQYFHPGGEMKCMTHLVGLNEEKYRAMRISNEVEHVFDSLDAMTQVNTAITMATKPEGIKSMKRYALPLCHVRQVLTLVIATRLRLLPSSSGEKITTIAKMRTKTFVISLESR